MKKFRLTKWLAIFSVIACAVSFPNDAAAAEPSAKQVIPAVSYEFKGNKKYDFEDTEPVAVMTYGTKTLGKMVITGSNVEKTTYGGTTAFGSSGNVSFSYEFNKSLLGDSNEVWHVVEDDTKKVMGQKLDADIQKGVLILQCSKDGDKYENIINPVTDFFNTTASGRKLYTTAGEDISQGMYYRIVLAYKTAAKDGEFLGKDTFKYKRHMEVYNFFVVENSGQISIHNLSLDEELLNYEGYDQELLKHGETLVDNSVTRNGFEIEKITDSYTVWVQHDDDTSVIAQTGDRFTDDGLYTITLKTRLGKQKIFKIYVFAGGADKGFSQYFGDGPVQAERVFREGAIPTYARGGRIHIKAVQSNVPALLGEVRNIDTDEIVFKLTGTRAPQNYSLKPGSYIAKFHNAPTEYAGSYYQYSFAFNVLDEDSAPYVNYHNLMTSPNLENLESKHLEVAYQMTSGGYIYVCFSMDSKDEALKYAQEIEGRFVEKKTEDSYYYKSAENPNRKVKYYDPIELTQVRNDYAKQNVEVGYFNPLDQFTYRTYENDLLDSLEKINSSESIKVFPSEEEKNKLFDRAPYINNFQFIQVSDYDVVSVTAENLSDGSVIELKFNVPVSSQLSKTGMYRITETNGYGKSRCYDVCFLASCETTMTWEIVSDGVKQKVNLSASDCENEPYVIQADSAYVIDIDNPMDKHAIVTIKAPDVYSFEIKCLASEFKNLEFTKAGDYEIRFIDRLGNSFEVLLKISGNAQPGEIQAGNTSYVEFYNSIYQNPKNVEEDIYLLSDIVVETEPEAESEDITDPTLSTTIPTQNQETIEEKDKKFNWTPLTTSVLGLAFVGIAVLIWKKNRKSKSEEKPQVNEDIENSVEKDPENIVEDAENANDIEEDDSDVQ